MISWLIGWLRVVLAIPLLIVIVIFTAVQKGRDMHVLKILGWIVVGAIVAFILIPLAVNYLVILP